MKQIKCLLLTLSIMFIGVLGVKAETVDASIKLAGRNTFGRELEIEVDCKDAGDSDCYITDTKWYYNDTNSTEGGTEIAGADNKGGSGYSNYYIEETMIGKYIYVVATISSYDSDYESITLKEITDAENNTTATVDDYIEYVDNSKYSIDVTATFEVGASLTLKLKGYEKNEDESVFVYFSNGEKPSIKQTTSGCEWPESDIYDYTKFKTVNTLSNEINASDDWFMLKGYDKAYIMTYNRDKVNGGYYCNVTEAPITVSKPSIPALGNRYKFYIFTDNEYNMIDTFPLFPTYGKVGSHKLITKIGKIDDNNLLKKLAKGTSDSLSLLLDYAKKNSGTTFEYSDETHETEIKNFKVTDGAYYYVYTTYENSNGIYRDLSDVTVVMAEHGNLVNDVKWQSSSYDYTTVWEQFVKAIKENELLKDITIEYDEDSMTMSYNDIKITFNYNDGIVSYVADENITDEEMVAASLYQSFVLQEFFEKFGYDFEKVSEYLENNNKLKIDEDGFEYIIQEFSYKDENGTVSGEFFSTLKFDLLNGLKNYSEKTYVDEKIPEDEAPKTGLAIGASVVLSLLAIGGVGLYTYKKSTNKNKFSRI